MTRVSYALAALVLGASVSAAYAVEPKVPNTAAVAAAPSDRSTASGFTGAQASVLTDVDRFIIQRNIRRTR